MIEKIALSLILIVGIHFMVGDVSDYWIYFLKVLIKLKWVFLFLSLLYLLQYLRIRFFLERIHHINTFFHELSHAIAVLVTGGKVISFNVNQDTSGNVSHISRLKTTVTLAPYMIPWMPLIIFVIYYFATRDLKVVLYYIFCFSFANYFFRIFRETRIVQTDIQKVGLIWSVILIGISNLFFILLFTALIR